MNFGPPTWVVEAAETALRNIATNHYAHPKGAARLRQAIKNFYGPKLNRVLNADTEILVSSGANGGNFPRAFAALPYPLTQPTSV
jgi:kynurenine aminotransferase